MSFLDSSDTRLGSGRGDEGPATGEDICTEAWLRAGDPTPLDSRDDCGEWKDAIPCVSSEAEGRGFCLSFRRKSAAVVTFGLVTGDSSVGLCKGEGGHDGFADIARGAVDFGGEGVMVAY